MDNGLPCDECGGPTYMHQHVDGVPTTCRECDQWREEMERQQHEEEQRALENQAMEEHLQRHPHG